ncbi:Protein polybromo-1 [Geodia barretti]|nr:Protein polybromo-1 [Geodia barretti]
MLNADTTHLVREADGHFYCRWANCPRNPRHGGRAFDAMPKITRHVKEVHLLKLSQTALGLNPRSHVIQGQVVRPPAPSPPAPSPVISLSSIPLPSNFASPSLPVAHIPIITPPPVPIGTNLSSSYTTSSVSLDAQQSVPSATVEGTPAAAPVSLSSVPSTAPPPSSDAPTTTSAIPLPISSIFVAPPVDKKPILHSAIYTKYIEGLQKGSKYSSSLQTTDQMSPAHRSSMTSSQIQVSDWLLPSAIPPNMSATEALVTLRDHLLRDSLRLGQHLDHFQ